MESPHVHHGTFRGFSGRRQVTDPLEAGRGSTRAGQEEEDIQERVDSSGRRWRQGWPLSKHHDVRVLLVQWEDENLGVDEEVEKLEAVLSSDYPKGYNFYTQRYSIPNDDPEGALVRRLLDFRKGATESDLLILYYAGHAGGNAQECIWSGKPHYDSPWLNWHNVQSLLLGSRADVLLILDCCFATLAARNCGIGDNWMLGASTKESEAAGVARNSFTSTLTRELERCADRYWSKQETLSAQSLDHAFIVWERDLDFTPKLTRLTDHDCPATDLTPLLHPRQRPRLQTTRTEPTPQSRVQGYSPLPSRSKVGKVKIESPNLRILNLPTSTDDLDIKRWFEDRTIENSSILQIGPRILSGSTFLGTIITFTDVDVVERAMKINDLIIHPRKDKWHQHAGRQLTMDYKFEGLTCIYSSTKGPDSEPTADVVLLHGAYGHPINSFAVHEAESLGETSWARESLPKELEDVCIFPRVMTYGWDASAWYDPQREVSNAYAELDQALRSLRTQTPRRPLILIGHGVGGFLIQQLVINTINFGFGEQNFHNPIQACFFFALPKPFEPSNITNILPKNHVAKPHSYKNLDVRANEVSKISQEFDMIRKEWSIECAFFKETWMSAKYQNSSRHDTAPTKPSFELDADPLGVARPLGKGNPLNFALDVIRKTLEKRPAQPFKARPPNVERVFAKLRGYDTRFLVDDSASMYGRGWKITQQVMAEVASIAVMYDKDGVDVRFFNDCTEDEERLNLDSAQKVMSLFDKLDPEGETPTADTLELELNEYVHKYKHNTRIKGLNLIVITDGAPSPGQDVEGVIVKYAKILAEQDAPPLQVGIQFVQIGDEKGAKAFLDSLDNDLQKKYNLDRDVSWLTPSRWQR